MNAEHLHAVALDLQKDLGETDVPNVLGQLVTSMQQLVNEPGQPSYQQAVSSYRTQLALALSASRTNDFSPAWRQTLEELGVDDLLGAKLNDRLDAIFVGNEITPTIALEQLTPLSAPMNELRAALDQLIGGLRFFEVSSDRLPEGEFEASFLIPRRAVGNDLGLLGEEFQEIGKLLGPFLELGTGSRPPVEVRSIASSDFQTYLAMAPGAAWCLFKAIDKLLDLYSKVLHIRKTKQDLEASGVPEENLEGIGDYASGAMENGILEIAGELVSEFGKDIEPGRANELKIEMKFSLSKLANRIDHGYSIAVRTGGVPEVEELAEGEDAERVVIEPMMQAAADAISHGQGRLHYPILSGPPILELPESEDEEELNPDQQPDAT